MPRPQPKCPATRTRQNPLRDGGSNYSQYRGPRVRFRDCQILMVLAHQDDRDSGARELLNAVVASVGDVDASAPLDGDATRTVELPVPAARAAPRGEEAPVAVELLDAIVGAAPEEPAQAQARESPAEGREGREAAGLWLPRATDLVAGGASRLKFTDTTRTLAAGFTSRPALPARCRGRSYCRGTRRRRRCPGLLRSTGCWRP